MYFNQFIVVPLSAKRSGLYYVHIMYYLHNLFAQAVLFPTDAWTRTLSTGYFGLSECMRFVLPNAVATINTVTSTPLLSLMLLLLENNKSHPILRRLRTNTKYKK